MNFRDTFRVTPGDKVDLDSIEADFDGSDLGKKEAEAELEVLTRKLRELQHVMYAENRRSLLVVLQGRDAAGKDGTIRRIFGPVNPQGCRVTSFKVPSKEEAAHDFLWRCHRATPARGNIAVFNRSHYEDVLVVRVHDLVPKKVWSKRYDQINAFESLLHANETQILKFFLNIDREEQLERFRKRIENPAKNWKISDADYSERSYWDDYTKAFENALQRCSTRDAPWFVIPSNRKWFRNTAIASIIVETMEKMKMEFPEPSVNMDEIRRKYHEADQTS
jgi:PPK2 family polyphosphate:nucleotide phosphotransferase